MKYRVLNCQTRNSLVIVPYRLGRDYVGGEPPSMPELFLQSWPSEQHALSGDNLPTGLCDPSLDSGNPRRRGHVLGSSRTRCSNGSAPRRVPLLIQVSHVH